MKITKIEIQKNSTEKYNIYVDNEYKCSLTTNSIIKYKIKENKEISEQELEEILNIDNGEKAYLYIINYLEYGFRTEKEIKDKLFQKKYPQLAINFAVEKAKQYGYINDEKYCKMYVETYMNNQHNPQGPQKTTQKLLQKGININIIKEIINEESDDNVQKEQIKKIIDKKIQTIKEENPYKKKQKIFNYLAQKGYNFDNINSILNEYNLSDNDY